MLDSLHAPDSSIFSGAIYRGVRKNDENNEHGAIQSLIGDITPHHHIEDSLSRMIRNMSADHKKEYVQIASYVGRQKQANITQLVMEIYHWLDIPPQTASYYCFYRLACKIKRVCPTFTEDMIYTTILWRLWLSDALDNTSYTTTSKIYEDEDRNRGQVERAIEEVATGDDSNYTPSQNTSGKTIHNKGNWVYDIPQNSKEYANVSGRYSPVRTDKKTWNTTHDWAITPPKLKEHHSHVAYNLFGTKYVVFDFDNPTPENAKLLKYMKRNFSNIAIFERITDENSAHKVLLYFINFPYLHTSYIIYIFLR
jgi:hypothetical protein